MVISKLNLDKIRKNIELIQEFRDELNRLAGFKEEEFLEDSRNPAACESFLRRSLEAVFDIGRHILSKSYGVKELEYKRIAKTLGDKEIIPHGFSESLIRMAGYRNRMVHHYREIEPRELYSIIQNHLQDFDRYCKYLNEFLVKYSQH